MPIIDAVALEHSEVICVTPLGSDGFEDLPVALRPLGTDFGVEMALQISGYTIIIQQRVVDIKEKDRVTGRHVLPIVYCEWVRLLRSATIMTCMSPARCTTS